MGWTYNRPYSFLQITSLSFFLLCAGFSVEARADKKEDLMMGATRFALDKATGGAGTVIWDVFLGEAPDQVSIDQIQGVMRDELDSMRDSELEDEIDVIINKLGEHGNVRQLSKERQLEYYDDLQKDAWAVLPKIEDRLTDKDEPKYWNRYFQSYLLVYGIHIAAHNKFMIKGGAKDDDKALYSYRQKNQRFLNKVLLLIRDDFIEGSISRNDFESIVFGNVSGPGDGDSPNGYDWPRFVCAGSKIYSTATSANKGTDTKNPYLIHDTEDGSNFTWVGLYRANIGYPIFESLKRNAELVAEDSYYSRPVREESMWRAVGDRKSLTDAIADGTVWPENNPNWNEKEDKIEQARKEIQWRSGRYPYVLYHAKHVDEDSEDWRGYSKTPCGTWEFPIYNPKLKGTGLDYQWYVGFQNRGKARQARMAAFFRFNRYPQITQLLRAVASDEVIGDRGIAKIEEGVEGLEGIEIPEIILTGHLSDSDKKISYYLRKDWR